MKTSLYQKHLSLDARMVDFAGWQMPIQYASQLNEHHAVRRDAGMFDVSHMLPVDLEGEGAEDYLRHLLANDVAKLKHGKALYSCMLNETAGVVDDLIVYMLGDQRYRVVVNAGCADKDIEWMETHTSGFAVQITTRRDLSMIAIQGPNARTKALSCMTQSQSQGAETLSPFFAAEVDQWLIARTGYTGEDGFEVMLPNQDAEAFWDKLIAAGVEPCGLGARDTLRLEAGMNLYGQDMTTSVSPIEAGLNWTIAWKPQERKFIGREALEQIAKLEDNSRLVGLLLEGRGILRNHQPLFIGDEAVGEITSGGFAPTLGRSIALARVSAKVKDSCEVEIRGKRLKVKRVKPPFVRNGKACIDI